ncbi:GntR-family transcriptional regulator [Streptomyces sp. L-9-10]|uniref:GntR family transcriptional regulator n=1 Tax=Streptomyces sp. L-9-10 TaxID=1478131 RepID=UPI00101DF0DB|nr:GntR family transcriptional regulator [Streptomyces sp. L-9-10]RYJ29737.1 GntR-family transcriptional regulator [Streptomyces sp. L-9-10]
MNGIGKPTSEEVAEALRARIESGELAAGQPIPTQKSLVEAFGVQRGVIRRALRSLQEDGLLTEVTRGAPPRIADRSAEPGVAGGAGVTGAAGTAGVGADETPQETMVALRPRITEAFRADHVRVDALCLTAESLSAALGEQRLRIQDRSVAPSSVTVRVLLPNRNIELAFPRSVSTADTHPDEGDLVHQRWLQQRNSHGTVLSDHLVGMRSAGIDVDVRFRALPFTPAVKLYVLNGTEALLAYYKVMVREAEIGRTSVEMYDALGDKSPLFSFVSGETRLRRDEAFVAESQAWFDALWDTIATDLALG